MKTHWSVTNIASLVMVLAIVFMLGMILGINRERTKAKPRIAKLAYFISLKMKEAEAKRVQYVEPTLVLKN